MTFIGKTSFFCKIPTKKQQKPVRRAQKRHQGRKNLKKSLA
jgi:hypothetical protein